MHVLDRDAVRGGAGHVANGPDRLQDLGNFRSRRIVSILAVLVAKLTCADVTPVTAARAFSIAGGQWAQVIPPMRSSICSNGLLEDVSAEAAPRELVSFMLT